MEFFNWIQFHKDLDVAMATMIMEDDVLQSKTTIMELAKFSNEKRKLMEG